MTWRVSGWHCRLALGFSALRMHLYMGMGMRMRMHVRACGCTDTGTRVPGTANVLVRTAARVKLQVEGHQVVLAQVGVVRLLRDAREEVGACTLMPVQQAISNCQLSPYTQVA